MTVKEIFVKSNEKKETRKAAKIINISILLIILIGVFLFAFKQLNYSFRWHTLYEYRYKFWIGFKMTVFISMVSLLISLLLGIFFAYARHSKIILLNYLSYFYVEIIRGTPFLVQIFIFFYVIGTAFNITNRYVNGIVILALFSGAYVTEIIRAGVESIESSQKETAKSIGFTKFQMYRYIIIPQVIKRIMPPLAGQFVSLVKDSSLLSVIAVNEFTKNYQEVDSITFATIENLVLLAIGYLVLTVPISYFSKRLERKFTYET